MSSHAQAPIAGIRPNATARACRAGASLNACAVMTIAIHMRMPSVASSGTTWTIHVIAPTRHSTATTTPSISEYPARAPIAFQPG